MILKTIKIKLIVIAVISIIAFAISIPTISFSINDRDYQIRGFKLADVSQNKILGDFSFQKSLELHGGNRYTYEISLQNNDSQHIQEVTDRVMEIMEARLYFLNLGEYKIYSLIEGDKSQPKAQIIVEVAYEVDSEIMRKLANRGEVEAWTIDYERLYGTSSINVEGAESETPEMVDPYAGTFFETRKQEYFKNEDIAFVSIVSDSRVFMDNTVVSMLPENDYFPEESTTPLNFGLKLHVSEDAKQRFLIMLSSNPRGLSPVIFSIDGEPVALQASGDTSSTNQAPDSILLYTFGDDTLIYNNSIAAFFSTPIIETTTYLTDVSVIAALLGDGIYRDMIIVLSIGLLLSQIVWIYYFKKRSKFGVIVNIIFAIWNIGLLKLSAVFGMVLTNSLIYGSWVATFVFMSFVALTTYRIRTLSGAGLTDDEVDSVIKKNKNDFRSLTILFIVIAWILQKYGTYMVDQFASGMGFGVLTGLFVVTLVFAPLLKTTFITRKS